MIKKIDTTIKRDLLVSLIVIILFSILYYFKKINEIILLGWEVIVIIPIILSIIFFIWDSNKLGKVFNFFYEKYNETIQFKLYLIMFLSFLYIGIIWFKDISIFVEFTLLYISILLLIRILNLIHLIFRFWMAKDFKNITTYNQKKGG